MIGTKPHAELAQCGARLLRQALDVFRDLGAIENAERFGNLEGDPARNALKTFAFLKVEKWAEKPLDVLSEPEIKALLHQFERSAGELLVRKHLGARLEQLFAGCDFADRLAEPANDAVIGQNKRLVDRLMHAGGTPLDFAGQGFLGRGIEGFGS